MSISVLQSRILKTGVFCAAAVAAGLCLLLAGLHPSPARLVFGRTAYYFMLALFLTWGMVTARELRRLGIRSLEFARRHLLLLCTAGILTTWISLTVELRFRVLSDETNLLSVSQSMFRDKTAYNVLMAKYYEGSLHPIVAELDKRPLGFPFAVNLLHQILGPTARSAFLLNRLVLFTLLATIGISIASLMGKVQGVAATVLAATPPLVALNGSCGGFDLLSTLLLAFVIVCLYRFCTAPDPDRLALLWVNLLLFANIRYESAIIVGVILAALIVMRKIKLEFLYDRWGLYCLSPLLLLVLAAQRLLVHIDLENGTIPAFAWQHFEKWIVVFCKAQFNWTGELPYATGLNWIALGTVWLALVLYERQWIDWKHGGIQTAITALAAIGLSYLIVFSYFFGDYTHAASARFFLNLSLVLALIPLLLNQLAPRWVTGPRLLGGAILLLVFYHSVAVEDHLTRISINVPT